ncbi:hypothetical protein JHK85_012932 [Glycine max]|uniref:VHS domain-containing protein n=1 Tax=Glycine max TaxID=3847 RepID=A0A0R0JTN1_SOYBN|nr:hypothetical protein JHK85_012932 [Glycine max]KAH1133800.1 hypothetical protein GYH30_012275 [Glycine max]
MGLKEEHHRLLLLVMMNVVESSSHICKPASPWAVHCSEPEVVLLQPEVDFPAGANLPDSKSQFVKKYIGRSLIRNEVTTGLKDISGKISPTLLKSLESPNWKVRMESVDAVNKILEEANKRIQAIGIGELFGALRERLLDSNKNIVMASLTAIGNVASAMGQVVEKGSKGVLSNILKCLGDNKKHMRECVLNTLDAWLVVVHLDKMIEKMVKDIHGPPLTLIVENLKPYAAFQGTFFGSFFFANVESFESGRAVSVGATSKAKAGKSTANGVSKHGNKAVSSRVVATKGAKSESICVQDIAVQSQALLNIKDSNKEDRERMVVRRFKFEDPRIEQIQDLEVGLFVEEQSCIT